MARPEVKVQETSLVTLRVTVKVIRHAKESDASACARARNWVEHRLQGHLPPNVSPVEVTLEEGSSVN